VVLGDCLATPSGKWQMTTAVLITVMTCCVGQPATIGIADHDLQREMGWLVGEEMFVRKGSNKAAKPTPTK
jgi:hypothetical protein